MGGKVQKGISNTSIDKEENCVVLSINTKIYPLDVVYSAAYIFIDRAYILLDGDPKNKVTVELRPKQKSQDLEKLGMDFNNELLNYAFYKTQSEKNKDIRTTLIQAALLANEPRAADTEDNDILDELDDDDFLDDPEGIAIPWEEKYGKEKKKA